MQRKSFADMACPIARSLEQVGEWWSMLILRDAFTGKTRFDEFQQSLGIAPNMLTRRLAALVAAGMLERRPYSARPPRHDYVLTDRGRDFRTVLVALLAFGDRHFAAEGGAGACLVDVETGEKAEPMLVDRRSGQPLLAPRFRIVRGRRAGDASAAAADGPGLMSPPEPAGAPTAAGSRRARSPAPASATPVSATPAAAAAASAAVSLPPSSASKRRGRSPTAASPSAASRSAGAPSAVAPAVRTSATAPSVSASLSTPTRARPRRRA